MNFKEDEIKEIFDYFKKYMSTKDCAKVNIIEDYITDLEKRITKSCNIINKFKETYIICFDKDLWGFVKRLEKALEGKENE